MINFTHEKMLIFVGVTIGICIVAIFGASFKACGVDFPQETQITTNPDQQYRPHVYGDNVVWVDHRNGNTDIYVVTIQHPVL
jgi:beta propeller repeat protein